MNNKIKKFFTSKKILIILVLLCGLLIGSSFFTDRLVKPLRSAVSNVVVPLQKGMNSIGIGVVDHQEKKKNIEQQQQAFGSYDFKNTNQEDGEVDEE